ncbi:MAG: hypothetical protein NTU91_01965 [Chloroflexi bacterium]|nr:hypothetical protein [Chloroflexota bacterium]
MRWAGMACLGLAALMAIVLAWPSSRSRIGVSLSGDQLQSAWVDLGSSAGAPDVSSVPSLTLSIDLPRSVLKGREESLGLAVNVSSESTVPAIYSLAAEVISLDADVTPPGESGQALRPGTGFEWTIVATSAPETAATLLVRLRRHSLEGVTEAERLMLARDIALPVRTVAGLSAPVARLAAAILGLAGSLLGIASALSRSR